MPMLATRAGTRRHRWRRHRVASHPRRRVLRKGFNHLLRGPYRRGMFRDVDVEYSPARGLSRTKTKSTRPVRAREEVHRHERRDMIGQKRSASVCEGGGAVAAGAASPVRSETVNAPAWPIRRGSAARPSEQRFAPFSGFRTHDDRPNSSTAGARRDPRRMAKLGHHGSERTVSAAPAATAPPPSQTCDVF